MFLYFYVHDATFFHEVLRPSLARAHRGKSFAPCQDLCRRLLTPDAPRDAIIRAVLGGLLFERGFWQAVTGECLVVGAVDVPRVQTAPDTYRCLLAPSAHSVRAGYSPIEQAHFGTRDLTFGTGFYRPDRAGLNDVDDVGRLATYLEAIDPEKWTTDDLLSLMNCADEEERTEELADARAWWPGLVSLYREARERGQVIVCEQA
jgi:hypothetical protein